MTMEATSSKPSACMKRASWGVGAGSAASLAASAGGTARSIGAVDSHMIARNTTAVAAQVHQGVPRPACTVLKKWRMVTPMRKVSEAMIQALSVAKAKGV